MTICRVKPAGLGRVDRALRTRKLSHDLLKRGSKLGRGAPAAGNEVPYCCRSTSWHVRPKTAQRSGCCHMQRGAASEWHAMREELEQHHAERVDISGAAIPVANVWLLVKEGLLAVGAWRVLCMVRWAMGR